MKYSRQREMIREAVAMSRTHPTADDVYGMLKPENPNISLATVYRNLNFLAEQGALRKITLLEGPDRFDGRVHDHYHMICTECGAILDLEYTFFNDIARKIFEEYDFVVTSHRLIVYGVCKNCNKNSEKRGKEE